MGRPRRPSGRPSSRVSDPTVSIAIGRPIANTRVYVLEPSGLPARSESRASFALRGEGVARGYRNRPELTLEKFVSLSVPGAGDSVLSNR